MVLEAVWSKNGKEVCKVDPVVNIVSYENIKEIEDIEVENGHYWYSYKDLVDEGETVDDFVIRIKKD